MDSEVSVNLAHALVTKNIELENQAPERLTVYIGQPFRIRFSYRVLEASPLEEVWRFKLSANLAGEDDAVSEINHKDRRVFTDNFIAHVAQEHVVPAAGEYELTWEAEAEILLGEWNDPAPKKRHDFQKVTGKIIVEAV